MWALGWGLITGKTKTWLEAWNFQPLSSFSKEQRGAEIRIPNWSWLCSVQFSCSVMSNSLRPRGLQHTRHPYPSPTPGAYANSCPLSQWCHPTISSSVIPFSHLQSFPESGSFQMSQFFTSGDQSTGVSASTSVLPMNIQDWFPLVLTSWLSLQCFP